MNRDLEEILTSWVSDIKLKYYPMAIKFVQVQKKLAIDSDR
jgi:hypothetical protein